MTGRGPAAALVALAVALGGVVLVAAETVVCGTAFSRICDTCVVVKGTVVCVDDES